MKRIELLSIVGAILAPRDQMYDENEVIQEAADMVAAAIKLTDGQENATGVVSFKYYNHELKRDIHVYVGHAAVTFVDDDGDRVSISIGQLRDLLSRIDSRP